MKLKRDVLHLYIGGGLPLRVQLLILVCGLFAKGTPIGRVVYDESKAPRVELFADFDRMVYVRVVDKPHDLNLRDIDTQ